RDRGHARPLRALERDPRTRRRGADGRRSARGGEWMNKRIVLARELGSYAAVSMESGNLSMVERQLGNLKRADTLAREALAIYQRRGDEWAMPYELSALAAVATERGALARAATLLEAAERM